MSKEIVDIMVEGGKASPGPQMGQAFGPLGVNIQEILEKINEKTKDFTGMKVPVTVSVDTETKEFDLEIGTPPVSELIKKELGIQKGSDNSIYNKVGNLAIEQIIKIAKMKDSSLLVNSLKAAVKTVVGSCVPMGILVEGKNPQDIELEIDDGKFDDAITSENTEVSDEKKAILKSQLEEVRATLEEENAKLKKKAEEEAAEAEKKPEGEESEEEKDKPEGGEATEEKKEDKKE
jgi:large subunit ribosomal protein L11